ncbi:TVP38/TMEM64 family protein [Chryseomicrobium sp. FSL W7-1435]|uniref:TVP38/TMEM64 family protein n=1 Tax=Chryseomicrobium sp. FSL W7-1435 TaxID=2921704 RepID=UPI00315A20EF
MGQFFTLETLEEIMSTYKTFGPFVGILLPMLEAFLPFLPLVVFIVANVTAYGLFLGFLLSWVGSVLGAYIVFLVVRKFGRARIIKFLTRHKRISRLIHWVERNGFGPLFLLLCFPFTPSAIVNLVAGLSNIRKSTYLTAVILGKFIMIFIISFIGADIRALVTEPIRTAIVAAVIVLLWAVGKYFERRLDKKVESDFREIAKQRASDAQHERVGR